MVPKYFSLNWHFLSHSPSRRQGELFYFSCLFPFLAQVPFYIFHGCICSATTSAICPFCCVSFLLFLLVVFVFLLVSLLLILLRHSFLSLDFCLLVFLPVFFLRFCVPCFFFLLFVLSSSCFFSFSCVSFCGSPLSCSYVFLCPLFSFRISFDFFFALCFFLLVPPLSHLLCFLLPRPPRALEKDNHGKNNYLILFAFRGSLRKCPLRKIIVFFFCGFLLSTEHVFVRYTWNMFWGSKGLFVASYLLLYRCFGVWWRAFFLSNLSLVPAFLGFVLFCVRVFFFYFGCFCFFGVLLRSVFLFCLSSSSWVAVSSLLCGRAGFSTSCLGCLFLRVGFGAFILWLTLLGGRSGRANREGSIYFSVFFIVGLFGRKQYFPRGWGFFETLFAWKSGMEGAKKMKRFHFCRAKRYKNRGFRIVSWRQKVRQPYLRNALLQLSCCDLKIFWYSVWGGAQNTHEIVTKRCKNRGFRDLEVVRHRRWKEGKLKRSRMARVYPFNNGVLMLRNISAPFLNALKVRTRVDISVHLCWKLLTFHRGKNSFLSFSFVPCARKKRRILEPIGEKKAPRNWTQQHPA